MRVRPAHAPPPHPARATAPAVLPLNWYGGVSGMTDASHSGFMRLTMSNIQLKDNVLWVHFFFIYIYLGWGMVLLRWHYLQVSQTGGPEGEGGRRRQSLQAHMPPAHLAHPPA